MQNLINDLKEALKNDERLVIEGDLNKAKIEDLALNMDTTLLKLLLASDHLKKHFFQTVGGMLVFDKIKFQKFVNNKSFLPDSYTAFKNKIGFTANEQYVAESKEVVLAWPHKDCVLEGGQEREEEKRDEIFWNEILAPDDIDRLLTPKTLTNWKKYDKNGEHEVNSLSKEDNYVIKGNNLLALITLKNVFLNKVKLIYIDPPYNTGNDSFSYNDRFNHSTWLTFMKNRLEIAKELLADNGAIFISINHIELGYLLVLMDEIFGRNNKLPIITLRSGTTASYRSINECPVNVSEYIVGYSKTNEYNSKPVYVESKYTEDYSHVILNIKEKPDKWIVENLNNYFHKKEGCNNWQEFKKKFGTTWKNERFEMKQKFALENPDRIVSLNTLQKPSDRISKVINLSKKQRNKVHVVERENDTPIYCYNGRTLAFFSRKFRELNGEMVPAEILTNLWLDVSFLGIGPEGDVDLPNGKKPELIIKHLIELATIEKDDIVMDFHLGSGTTCAVAHKMNKRYIGIEQLDYGENDAVNRLRNVINGDRSGISEEVNWQSGGSFVYCELKEANQSWVNKIKSCVSTGELNNLWQKMKEEAFISYKIDIEMFNETVKDFEGLSLEEQKMFLIEVLDKNLLYVNYSEIEDQDFKVSEEDKKLNHLFYSLNQ